MPRRKSPLDKYPELRERLAALPDHPGVYFFRDTTGAIIYIGKSVSLRSRVRSYFTGKPDSNKTGRLRQEIAALDWQITGSELEALLLESRLVKRHLPRFNRMLRAFHPRPYLRVDLDDPYPRLDVTREPRRDGARYFGPYRRMDDLEQVVETLSGALGLRNCPERGAALPARPCYRAEIAKCAAPCAGQISVKEYRARVLEVVDGLEGRGQPIYQRLEGSMALAADQLRFELAARLRDALTQFRQLAGRQHALQSAVARLSLLAVCPSAREDSVCLFLFLGGRLRHQLDVPYAELADPLRRSTLAHELAAVSPPEAPDDGVYLDSAALDEVQIISGWMKQKTREGYCVDLPEETPDARALRIAGALTDTATPARRAA